MSRPCMTEVIAERVLEVVTADGTKETLTIQVGKPAPIPEHEDGDWYCPYRFEGLGRTRFRFAYGIDALQALHLVLGILELDVRDFAGDTQLTWLEQDDLRLKPWIPAINV